MAKPALALSEKLNKYKISLERYQTQSQHLLELCFTAEQADRLILRPSSATTVQEVIRLTSSLQTQYCLSIDEIVRMASRNGGGKNLQAYMQHHEWLSEQGFTKDSIMSMASHDGGSKNLAVVQAAFTSLKDLKFTAEQIVQMVSHDGGSENLKAVQAASTSLKALSFTAAQIVQMVSHDGGSKNLTAVQTSLTSLEALGFNAEQVVKMVSHNGGSKNLGAVHTCFTSLQRFKLSTTAIVSLTSKNGGSVMLQHFVRLECYLDSFASMKSVGALFSAAWWRAFLDHVKYHTGKEDQGWLADVLDVIQVISLAADGGRKRRGIEEMEQDDDYFRTKFFRQTTPSPTDDSLLRPAIISFRR